MIQNGTQELSVGAKILKFLEENIKENQCVIGLGKNFSKRTQNP